MSKRSTDALMDEAYQQVLEDRELIRESYDKFSEQVTSIEQYAVAGQNLNKCLELLSKQSAQLIEIAKLASAVKRQAGPSLSDEENEEIYNELKH